jgi:hypothetical protein
MPKTKSPPKFKVGDVVRVKPGVADPDYDDLPIGGRAGAIAESQRGNPPLYLIRWNQQTLDNIRPIHKNRCERDGFDFEEMWLAEEDLEPDTGEAVEIEQPTNIVTKPLSMDDEDDRIRAIFGLTSDDLPPDVDAGSLHVYQAYLSANLSLPFEAKYSKETGPFSSKTSKVQVVGLGDTDDPWIDDKYGIICSARMGRQTVELPLSELEVIGKENRQLVADYSSWFWNWQ